MLTYQLKTLSRDDYLSSIENIEDPKSLGFARHSLKWWDRHFSWKKGGCVVLCDKENNHLCYIFYKIDRYRDYLTIHHLFTPLKYRRSGYAKVLLNRVFLKANSMNVKRFRATCVPQSLDFYLSLGFAYWGLTPTKNYYCDLPIPEKGLEDLGAMILRTSTKQLIGTRKNAICSKIKNNEKELNDLEQRRYDSDKEKMQEALMLDQISCIMS